MNKEIMIHWSKIKVFIKDMIINTFSFGIYILAQHIILMPIMSRALSQEAYANYIIYISVFSLISNILGSELGIVRQVRNNGNENKGKYYNRILLNLIPIILGFSIFALYFLKYSFDNIIFLSLTILLANIRLYSVAYFRIYKDFKKVLIQNVFYLIGLVVGLLLYQKFTYIWIPTLVAEIFALIYNIVKTDIIKEGLAKKSDKEILKTFMDLGFISLLGNGMTYFDKILIYPILGRGICYFILCNKCNVKIN